jgi:epidermal growth factor receptor substrate 15
LADPTGKGYLDRQAFYVTLKLIALSQSSQEIKLENLNHTTPAPKLVSNIIIFNSFIEKTK